MKKKFFRFEKKFYGLLLIVILFTLVLLNSCGESSPVSGDKKITIAVTPASLEFGAVLLNQSKKLDVSIENTSSNSGKVSLAISGTDKSNFTIVGVVDAEIDGKKSQNFTIEFLNNAERKYQAVLTITYNTIETKTINLIGEASTSLSLDVSPSSADFSKVSVGQSKSIKIAVRNTALTSFLLTPVIVGTDSSSFSITYKPSATLETGKIDSVVVKFTPTSVKPFNAVLYLDPEKKYSVPLKGEGLGLNELESNQSILDFGTINKDASKELDVTITNKTSSNLTISNIVPAGFSITNQPSGDLLPGVPTKITVKFTPTELKKYSGNLTITTSTNNKYYVALQGEGVNLIDLEVSLSSLDFQTINKGASKDLDVMVTNKSSSNFTVNCVASTGFSVFNQPAGDLLPGVPSKITVRFTPTETKAYIGTLTITTSTNSKYFVQLKGVGGTPTNLDLTANFTSTEPVIDGDEDLIWASAPGLDLYLSQVESTYPDKRTYNATIKALYSSEYIYFYVKVKDDTQDDSPNTFLFKGGDASLEKNWTLQTNGQDGISFMFPSTANVQGDDASKTFEKYGCYTTCHTTTSYLNYEGGSYPTKGNVDIWYWKAVSTNPQGYADDYVGMGSDARSPNERRGDEPGDVWADPNFRPIGTGDILPVSVPDGDNNGLDKSKYIWDALSSPFSSAKNNATGSAWAAGDKVPGWKLLTQTNEFTQRADILAKGKYVGGYWIVEFKRKLDTQNSNNSDAVFKAGNTYPFSFAYFDNTRYYSKFEYLALKSSARPGHVGSTPAVINLIIK